MNLKEANLYDYPIWYKLYTTRAAYNMKALRPVDWSNLIDEMANNQELFDLYYKWVRWSQKVVETVGWIVHIDVVAAENIPQKFWGILRSSSLES